MTRLLNTTVVLAWFTFALWAPSAQAAHLNDWRADYCAKELVGSSWSCQLAKCVSASPATCDTGKLACPAPRAATRTLCRFAAYLWMYDPRGLFDRSESAIAKGRVFGFATYHGLGSKPVQTYSQPMGECGYRHDGDVDVSWCEAVARPRERTLGHSPPDVARATAYATCVWHQSHLVDAICVQRMVWKTIEQARPTFTLAFTPKSSPAGEPVAYKLIVQGGARATGVAKATLYSDSACTKPVISRRVTLDGVSRRSFSLGSLGLRSVGRFYAAVRYDGDINNYRYRGRCRLAFEHT